nr:hypothetical protein Itr_chr10CG02250 [Ipomoea trifida]GMD39702.1 hypothetical protein Iba_chr10aCG2290 [Ipomoea batatas]
MKLQLNKLHSRRGDGSWQRQQSHPHFPPPLSSLVLFPLGQQWFSTANSRSSDGIGKVQAKQCRMVVEAAVGGVGSHGGNGDLCFRREQGSNVSGEHAQLLTPLEEENRRHHAQLESNPRREDNVTAHHRQLLLAELPRQDSDAGALFTSKETQLLLLLFPPPQGEREALRRRPSLMQLEANISA